MATRPPSTRSMFRYGCGIPIVFLILICLGDSALLYISNGINHVKWNSHHIDHYRLVVDYGAFAASAGTNQIEVKDGQVIQVSSRYCDKTGDCNPKIYDHLTIERLFEIPDNCTLIPLFFCTYDYNKEYG